MSGKYRCRRIREHSQQGSEANKKTFVKVLLVAIQATRLLCEQHHSSGGP